MSTSPLIIQFYSLSLSPSLSHTHHPSQSILSSKVKSSPQAVGHSKTRRFPEIKQRLTFFNSLTSSHLEFLTFFILIKLKLKCDNEMLASSIHQLMLHLYVNHLTILNSILKGKCTKHACSYLKHKKYTER